MQRRIKIGVCLAILVMTGGCVAKTALSLATAPVRVASKTADMLTTSQSESDEKRGRALRQREKRLGMLDRQYRRESERCSEGREESCDRASALYDESMALQTAPQ